MTEPVPANGSIVSRLASKPKPAALVAGFSIVLLGAIPWLFPSGIDPRSQQNWLDLFAKFMALAILALSVDLVWGYTGLLSLGQGVFFGIGAYMIAYCLTLQQAALDAKPRITDGEFKQIPFHYGPNPPPTQELYTNESKCRIESIHIRVLKPAASTTLMVSKLPFGSLSADAAEPIHNDPFDVSGSAGEDRPLPLKGNVPEEMILRRLESKGDKLLLDITGDAAKAEGEITLALIPEIEEPMKPGEVPPQFMQYTGFAPNDRNYEPPPGLKVIAPLGNPWTAIAASLVFPPIVAALFGFVIFRLGVRGVYFALVTQAFLLAVFLLVDNQQRFTGGHVGIKDMASLQLLGQSFDAVKNVRATVLLVAGALIVSYLLCALLVRSKFGKVLTAIRDNENRVLALGYTTALYKTFVFSFAGLLAGLSGALYVLANHPVCGATYLSVPFSIEAVILVAVGGRGGLYGAVLGALLVGFGQYYIQSALPDFWPIAEGTLFVITVLFLPRGLSPAAGPGALLGLLGGVFFIIYLDKSSLPFLSDATVRRIFIGCPVILLSVFIPRIVTLLFQRIIGAAAKRLVHSRPVSPVPS